MCTGKQSLRKGLQALHKGKFELWHGTAEEEGRGVGKEWSV